MNNRKIIIVFAAITLLFTACKPKTETSPVAAVTQGDTSATGKKITEITNLIAANPDNAELYYTRSQLYIEQRNFNDASKDIYKAIGIDSSKADYFIALSDVQLAANKPSQAKQSLEKSLSLQPDSKEGNMKLAELFFIARQYDEVFKHLNNILRKEINNPKAYMMKGMAYKELGDTAKAISSFQTAIEQDPKYYAPFMQLGVLFGEKKSPLAEQYFTGAVNVNPRSEEALYGRAMYYQEVKHDFDKAIQDYTSILQINPKNKNAHFNLGYIHYEYLKVRDQAVKHYTDAINVDPYYAEAIYNRGLAYEALGNIAAAKADYEQALKVRPGYELAIAGLERVK
ncbi:MAG: tetratricopeptide repeat protein [Bacteroidota bacterium]